MVTYLLLAQFFAQQSSSLCLQRLEISSSEEYRLSARNLNSSTSGYGILVFIYFDKILAFLAVRGFLIRK